MDAVAYVGILEKTLLPMIDKLCPNGHRFIQIMIPSIHLSRLNSSLSIMESTGGIPYLSPQTVT